MYGTIRRYQLRSGDFDEMVNRVKTSLVPLLEKTPGFVSYYLLNTNDNRVTSFTVCDNQASVDQVNRVALDWVKSNFANQLTDPEIIAGRLPIAFVHQHA